MQRKHVKSKWWTPLLASCLMGGSDSSFTLAAAISNAKYSPGELSKAAKGCEVTLWGSWRLPCCRKELHSFSIPL